MNKTRNPDFVGKWGNMPVSIDDLGFFKMYIDKGPQNLKKLKSHMLDITGIIVDCYGKATFKGSISLEAIIFTKQYTPQAIQKGASEKGVEYLGWRFNDKLKIGILGYIGQAIVLPNQAKYPFSMEKI